MYMKTVLGFSIQKVFKAQTITDFLVAEPKVEHC